MAQILLPTNQEKNNYKVVISILEPIEDIWLLSYHKLAIRRVIVQILERIRRENVSYWKQRGKKSRLPLKVTKKQYFPCFFPSYLLHNNKIIIIELNGVDFFLMSKIGNSNFLVLLSLGTTFPIMEFLSMTFVSITPSPTKEPRPTLLRIRNYMCFANHEIEGYTRA